MYQHNAIVRRSIILAAALIGAAACGGAVVGGTAGAAAPLIGVSSGTTEDATNAAREVNPFRVGDDTAATGPQRVNPFHPRFSE